MVEDNFEKLSNNLLKSHIESDFKQEYKIQIILIFLTKIVFLDTLLFKTFINFAIFGTAGVGKTALGKVFAFVFKKSFILVEGNIILRHNTN